MESEPILGHLTCLEATMTDSTQCLRWLYDAGNPYWEWLWGSGAAALSQFGVWIGRPNSEISLDRVMCISDSRQVYGGYIALSGHELQQCRKADFLALLTYARRNPSAGLLARMRITAKLFSTVSEDEYYLSRIGVQPDLRGMGIGRQLLKAYFESGSDKGFGRFRLDVDVSNKAARSLYAASRFTVSCVSEAGDVPFQYCSMVATI